MSEGSKKLTPREAWKVHHNYLKALALLDKYGLRSAPPLTKREE
jgi:hypothetical protein